jgi:acyl-CoA reductase-like NAD-dependent aldehyde dehydrogenase
MSTDRIILLSPIAPFFLAALKAALQSRGPDAPSPTLISLSSKARVTSLVADALSAGAHVHFAPDDPPADDAQGVRFDPVVLGGMSEDMRLWQEEAFAPVVGYMVVDTEDEAIDAANKTDYGLSAAVFTRDLRRGLAVARRIRSG